eukprot:g22256.t1
MHHPPSNLIDVRRGAAAVPALELCEALLVLKTCGRLTPEQPFVFDFVRLAANNVDRLKRGERRVLRTLLEHLAQHLGFEPGVSWVDLAQAPAPQHAPGSPEASICMLARHDWFSRKSRAHTSWFRQRGHLRSDWWINSLLLLSSCLVVATAEGLEWRNCGLELSHAPACAPVRDAEVPKAGLVGFVFGSLAASAVYWIQKQREKRMQPSKASHPREWAVWTRLDRKRRGYVTRKDIRSLCYRFESDEHAEHLAQLLERPARRSRTGESNETGAWRQRLRRFHRQALKGAGVGVHVWASILWASSAMYKMTQDDSSMKHMKL